MTEWTVVFSDAGTSDEKHFRPQPTRDAALTQAADLHRRGAAIIRIDGPDPVSAEEFRSWLTKNRDNL